MKDVDEGSLRWEEESREKESSFGIFDVYRVTQLSPTGQRGRFTVVDAPDWVTVIPLLQGEGSHELFVMVRQFRHGSRAVTLEFPAGVIEPGEEPAAAAARELAEETGYAAEQFTLLGASNPNPSFMRNTSFTFLARGLHEAGPQALDPLELVEVKRTPVDRVVAEMGAGEFDNGMMLAALGYYLRWKATGAGA